MKTSPLCLFALLVASAATLAACSKAAPDAELAAEIARRESFAKSALEDAGAARAFGVSSTSEIFFEEGFSQITFDPPEDYRNHAFRWMGPHAHVRLKSHGDRRMKLQVIGWVNEKVVRSKAVISLFLDGELLTTTGAIENGHYWAEAVVAPERLGRPFVDLDIETNAVAFHWAEPPKLQVALVYKFTWAEAP